MVHIGSLALISSAVGLVAAEKAEGLRNIAIIGAGAAGTSTAYHLRQFADGADDVAVNITVFEKSDRIGGRTLTVGAYGNDSLPVELGASIFVPVNYIMYGAAQEFNFTLSEGLDDMDGTLGIWDGKTFRYQQSESGWQWWNYAKLFWKYGMAPYRTQKLVKSTVDTFLQMYEAPWFPFRSLTQRAFELGLTKITGITGKQFLEENQITEPFAGDIIQAATRVNYASNLEYIHGLECMVSMAPEGAVQVVGGNWQIFSAMANRSRAALQLGTTVTGISLEHKDEEEAAATAKYLVSTKKTKTDDDVAEEAYPVAFDHIVVANPWQFSGIDAGKGTLQDTIDKIPYVKLHVTLFATPFKLSPEFFGLGPGSKVPTSVLTTLLPGEKSEPGSAAAGTPGFFSVSTLRAVTNPKTHKAEFLYKIFSPDAVDSRFLSDLLGVKVPESITGTAADIVSVDPISWYYPHVFHSYPIEYPRVTFQDPIVGRGLYYTSGMESFISTMETSALMGKNVARLIIDEMMGVEEDVLAKAAGDKAEKVMGGKERYATGQDMGEL